MYPDGPGVDDGEVVVETVEDRTEVELRDPVEELPDVLLLVTAPPSLYNWSLFPAPQYSY